MIRIELTVSLDGELKTLSVGGKPCASIALKVLRFSADAREAWDTICAAAINAAELEAAEKE